MKKHYTSIKGKKIAFYCRIGSTAFGCILPDEADILKKFFAENAVKDPTHHRCSQAIKNRGNFLNETANAVDNAP